MEQTADSLTAEDLTEVDVQRERFARSYESLLEYLERSADEATAQGWAGYIDAGSLVEADSADAVEREQIDRLRSVYWRMARNVEGLERAPLQRLRRAARALATRATLGERSRALQRIQTGLRKIASIVRDNERPLATDELAEINYYLPYIQLAGLELGVGKEVREHFSEPNVRVLVSEQLVDDFVRRPVLNTGPSRENILGTLIVSDTRLEGELSTELRPNEDGATILLQMDADFSSRGTGYNRKIQFANRGNANVHVAREIVINEDGFLPGDVKSSADLATQLLGVCHPLRIVRKIAGKKAIEQKALASSIAEQRLEDRLLRQFEEETGAALTPKPERVEARQQLADTLARLDIEQAKPMLSSTDDRLQLSYRISNDSQVSTDTIPTPADPRDGLVVQAHQSVVLNVATWVLGLRTLTDKELESFADGLIPEDSPLRKKEGGSSEGTEASDEVEEDPLEIQFAPKAPVVFEADQGEIRFGVYGIFRQRDRQVLPLKVSAGYKAIKSEGLVTKLVREGDVITDDMGAPRSLRRTAIKSAVRAKFEKVFPDEIEVQPIDIPQPPDQDDLPKRQLLLTDIQFESGWITSHFQMQSLPLTPSGESDQ